MINIPTVQRYGEPDPGIVVDRKTLGKDKVHFTGHSIEQMGIRGIKQYEVFDVLDAPEETGLKVGRKGRKHWRRWRNQTTAIDVIFEIEAKSVRIITAIKKKLKMPPGMR